METKQEYTFDHVPEFKNKEEEAAWRRAAIRELLSLVAQLKKEQMPEFIAGAKEISQRKSTQEVDRCQAG